ncbi:hypothetical protein NEPAR06_1904 [Nematocida parisii]|nr:hypothetical protein NEPAR07_1963 [Nematocida parisii]KAI5155522.1 hypothetical protein NEPAR06_1904 [Nematocida parisii]KAI5158676.1 hypothetical protein NEPAR05_2203 [Nematocida parisii]
MKRAPVGRRGRKSAAARKNPEKAQNKRVKREEQPSHVEKAEEPEVAPKKKTPLPRSITLPTRLDHIVPLYTTEPDTDADLLLTILWECKHAHSQPAMDVLSCRTCQNYFQKPKHDFCFRRLTKSLVEEISRDPLPLNDGNIPDRRSLQPFILPKQKAVHGSKEFWISARKACVSEMIYEAQKANSGIHVKRSSSLYTGCEKSGEQIQRERRCSIPSDHSEESTTESQTESDGSISTDGSNETDRSDESTPVVTCTSTPRTAHSTHFSLGENITLRNGESTVCEKESSAEESECASRCSAAPGAQSPGESRSGLYSSSNSIGEMHDTMSSEITDESSESSSDMDIRHILESDETDSAEECTSTYDG